MSLGEPQSACSKGWPLVGRDAATAELDEVAAQVLVGRSTVVRIEGPAGIGKSALLSSWCGRADSFRVLRARCHPLESEFAFGAVRQLFKPLVDPAGEAGQEALRDGTATAALRVLDDRVAGGPPEGSDVVAAALSGLDGLALAVSARRPLLLAIDDLQWIDTPSLRWLTHFVRRAGHRSVLVVVTNRTTELRKPDPLVAELVHPTNCHTLTLEPLDVAAVRELAQAVWDGSEPEASFCATCHAATGGHPLFVRALLHEARIRGALPTAGFEERIPTVNLSVLGREIMHRLSQASDAAVQLAHALAVLGDHKPPQLLAAYCEKGDAVVRAAASDLRALGLLRAEGQRFVHRAVRDTVLATFSPEELGREHARAAQVSYLGGRPDEEVAAHLLAAGPVVGEWVLLVLRRAADAALVRGAPEVAVTYLRSALNQPLQSAERGSVLFQLGIAAGHYDAALALSYITSALETLTDERARQEALGVLTYSLLFSHQSPTMVSNMDRVIGELSSQADYGCADREVVLRVRALRAWMEYERPSAGTLEPLSDAADLAGRSSGERQLLALHAFHALRQALPAPYVRELVNLASVSLPVFSYDLYPLHYFVVQTLFYLDDLTAAERLHEELAQETSDKGMDIVVSALTVYQSALALRRGKVREALAAADRVVSGSGTGAVPYGTALDIIRIDSLLEQGRVAEAEQIALAHTAGGPSGAAWERPLFLMCLGGLRVAQGDIRAGLSLIRECGHEVQEAGTVNPAVVPWRSKAAAAHLRLGERSVAHELIEQELDLARRCGIPRALGVTLRTAGSVTGGAAGLEQLAESVDVLGSTPARLELAYALHDFGAASLERGDRSGAREILRRGLRVAGECGATALADRVRDRLHEAGGRVTRSSLNEGPALTPGEERVSALAAQGYRNKEIAERLFVSLRTVETHLTGAYRKLGIAGRSGLAAAMAGRIPPPDEQEPRNAS
ncbi:ATP-binding protein [Streptomyces sp. NPDC048639]|uniref:ATP-binding protein n=1 Tax=Streptomyces sp. NPDC048639 TaxID=3365581 RepID=UPI00371BB17D